MDGPIIDLGIVATRRVIKQAKKRGYLTSKDLDRLLPSGRITPEQLEDVINQLAEAGINLVEEEGDVGGQMAPPANSNERRDPP